jgi:GNAT superfamily N-acetyltransferase
MIALIRTNSENSSFVTLVRQLDAHLTSINGDADAFYSQYNKIDSLKHVLVAFENETPVACGAMKEYEPGVVEVKRMYTVPAWRGKGIATQVLLALEVWAAELGYKKCILETGRTMPAAVLYRSRGYTEVPNYGQYVGVDNSVCFAKELTV